MLEHRQFPHPLLTAEELSGYVNVAADVHTCDLHHLMRLLHEYVRHYNTDRPHRSLGQTAPIRPLPDNVIDLDARTLEGFGPLQAGLELPDLDDRHVLAAAIHGGAQLIVTFNLKDALAGFDIEPVHPDAFLLDQLDLAPAIVLDGLRTTARRFKKPPMDLGAVLAVLENNRVPDFAEEVRRRAL